MKISSNRLDRWIYFFVFAVSSVFLFWYLSMSNDEMPLMDFWIGFEEFAKKVFEQKIRLSDIFPIPHGLYWGALGSIENIFIMKVFACNNLAYVYGGMIFCVASVALVLRYYSNIIAYGSVLRKLVFAVVCISPIIILNQWEIIDLWCSLSFMQRIFFYLLGFLMVDKRLACSAGKKKKEWICYIGIGVFGAFIVVCASSVYYPGFVASLIIVTAVHLFVRHETKPNVLKLLTMDAIILVGTIFNLLTTTTGAVSANATLGPATGSGSVFLVKFIQGIIITIASSVVPQTKMANGFILHYVIGIVLLLLVIISIWLFFKERLFQISWFPVECLIYSGVSAAVITYGRLNSYGLSTLTSSRYVVETKLGLLGIILIGTMLINKQIRKKEPSDPDGDIKLREKKAPIKAICFIMVLFVFSMICYSNSVELKIGPYRKANNQRMIQLALQIDQATDSELGIFQSSPANVRSGIHAMQKYNLCLWNEKSAYYQATLEPVVQEKAKMTPVKGVYDDGWLAPDAVYNVVTEDETMIRMTGYYPWYVDKGENITILLNGQAVKYYSMEAQTFTIDIPVGALSEYTLEIHSSFSHVSPPDVRTLSFLLSSISLVEEDINASDELQNAA